jgi:hypothetical protein
LIHHPDTALPTTLIRELPIRIEKLMAGLSKQKIARSSNPQWAEKFRSMAEINHLG